MKTQTHPARPPGPTVAGPDGSAKRSSWVVAFVVLGVTAVVVMAVLLSIYPRRELDVPIGWDMSEYLWRTTRAQDVGLAALADPLPSLPLPKSGRPAFPVVAGTLSSLFAISPFRLAFVLPSVVAAIIGLAAGAFVGGVLRRPLPEVVATALAVSLSSFVVRLMMPEAYMDTMFAAAVFMAALVPVLLSLERRAALVPAVLLVGAGGVIHWSFFAFVAATLALTGVAMLPASWRRWRKEETAWWDTPTARLGGVLLGGAAIGGGALYGLLGTAPRPRTDVSEFVKKLRRDLPRYHLPFTIPAAVLGAGSLAADGRQPGEGRSRAWPALAVLASWCAVVAGGYVAMTVFDADIPAHRFFSFGLAIPLLGILGVLWLRRLVARAGRPFVGWALVAAALAASAFVAYGPWFEGKPWTDGAKIRDAEVAAAYLRAAGVPEDRPVVYIMNTADWNGAGLMSHMLRAGLPSERIKTAYVFMGSAEGFLARRPDGTALSRSYFARIRSVYGRDPVAVILQASNKRYFAAWALAHPNSVIEQRVAVVRGPPPSGPLVAPEGEPTVGTMSVFGMGVAAVSAIGLLFLVGAGWALALLRRLVGPVEVLALAPAVGVAALVVGGVVLDRLGARPGGLSGALIPVAVGLAGWIVFALAGRRRPEPSRASPAP